MDASMEDLGRCPGIGERKVSLCVFIFYLVTEHVFFLFLEA